MFYREDTGGVQPYPGAFEGVETNEENNLKEKNLKKYINFNHQALIFEWDNEFV